MRGLDPTPPRGPESVPAAPPAPVPRHVTVIGAGRLGPVLADGLREAGVTVRGPLRRGDPPPQPDTEAILLCVPDAAIEALAAVQPPGPRLGHCSGASDLTVLGPRPAFSLHPLMALTPGADAARLHGAGAAVAGSDPGAREYADALARALRLRPLQIEPADRAAYHAAASVAANFLITLEVLAERLGESAGLPRAALVPLARASLEDWARGGAGALTGPIARGDAATLARQRAAVAERRPEDLALFDALAAATASLAGEPPSVPAVGAEC